MRDYSNVTKRLQAVVLALALVFSAVNPILWLGISAGADATETLTYSEIIADNYDELSLAEKALLKGGYLESGSVTYSAPSDGDDLVEVDNETKTIKAKTFVELGLTWVPTEAKLVSGEYSETVALSEGKGTYVYDGNAFYVDVTYVLYVDIDEATQNKLLSAAPAFKQGLANLEAVAESETDLSIILLAMDIFNQLASEDGMPNQYNFPLKFYPAAANATKDLEAQVEANDGKFDLGVMLSDYAAAESKVQFLVEKGEALKTCLKETSDHITTIRNDGMWATVLTFLQLSVDQGGDSATLTKVNTLLGAMDSWLADVAPVIADDWTAATTEFLVDDVAYATLESIVTAITSTTDVTVKETLVAATSTVRVSMSMFNVDVAVVFNVYDNASGQIVEYKTIAKQLVLNDGASADEIKAAAAAVEADALAQLADVFVEGKFDRAESALPDSLKADTEYVIEYTPKNFKVTYKYDGTSEDVPYGKNITLPVASAGMAYDYYVDGVKCVQGSVITVEDDVTIDRELGKAYVDGSLMEIVSNHYFTDDKSAAILTSGALLGDKMISVRYPEDSDGLVTLAGSTLTAQNFASGYNGLVWAPYSYTIVTGSNEEVKYFGGANEVTVESSDYDRVEVVYHLDLDVADDDVLTLVNLPYVLDAEAALQKSTLDRLAANTDMMKGVNKTVFSVLGNIVDGVDLHSNAAKNEELKAFFKGIIADITNNCFASNGYFNIYNILTAYNDEGLVYYYANSDFVLGEIEKLSDYLSLMLETDEKVEALKKLVSSAGSEYASYADKIVDLKDKMAEVKNDLKVPNAAIDTKSENLYDLVMALNMSGSVSKVDALPKALYLESAKFIKAADTKITATYTVQVAGKAPVAFSFTYNKDYVLTTTDVANIIDRISAEANALLGDKAAFYTTDYNVDIFKELVGKEAIALADVASSFKWTAKTVDVMINGEDSGMDISIDSLTITLPTHASAAYRYDYVVDGTVFAKGGKYTFTQDQLVAALSAGSVKITRTEVSVAQEELTAFVNNLNDSVSGNAIEFALVEKSGKFTIVMKVNAANPGALVDAVKDVAMTLVTSGYSYIGLDSNDVLYTNENGELKVSLQAIIDTVMYSGIGTQTIIDVMDANGNIKNITVDGNVISNADLGTFGGEVLHTSMQLGSGAEDAIDLDFYATLGSAPSQLLKVRNLLANELKSYFNVVCADGKATVNLTLPQKAYEAYLAVLLATDNLDLSDINAVNGEIAIGFVKDLLDPIVTGSVTTQTLTNTLNMLGFDIDLVGYEDIFSRFCDKYSSLEIVYDDDSATTTTSFGIAGLVDSIDIPGISSMIAEYSTGLSVTGSVALKNIGNDYEAIYLDIHASGIANKIGLTADLQNKLANVAGGAVIVLLDDIDGDLVFNTTTVLNLNGFRVAGNVTCNGDVTIVDSSLSNNGGVDKNVTGNATIIAGKYSADVTSFLKAGYVQNADGVVGNEFFDVVKDENGDITLELNAGILATTSMPNIKALALDAVLDLLFNGYTTNYLSVEGNEVFDLTYRDFIALYLGTDRLDSAIRSISKMLDSKAVANVINMLIEDVTDFAALKEAIENDKPVVTYEIETGAWSPAIEHVIDDDYLTISLRTSNVKKANFNVAITGTEEDKAILAGIMGVLDETVDANATVGMDHYFVDKNLVLDWSASGSLVVDLSDPDYIIMLSVILADGIGAPANADLVAGIKAYYNDNELYTLETAFNALTTSQAITAVKNLGGSDSFEAMIDALGLTGLVSDDVVEIEKLFDSCAKIFAKVVRELPFTGGTRTLGSYRDADGTYGFARENLSKSISRDIAKGYSITLNADVESILVSIKLFGDLNVPEFVDGTGTPTVGASDKIAGSYVDTANKYIYIDANVIDLHNNGITVAELKEALTFYAKNADTISVVIGSDVADSLVCNGDKLVATASNNVSVVTALVEYTVIIIGDVNGNGRTDTGDAALIAEYYVGLRELSDIEKLAADIGRNGRVDIGDASLVATKYVTDWKKYISAWK